MNAVATTHKTNTFKWLLKREFWENRGGFFWAPLIAGGIVAVLYTLLAVIGSIAGRDKIELAGTHEGDIGEMSRIVGGFADANLLTGVGLAFIVLAFVAFFYALGSLYDDRRDRSVLFWKSLPVSDTQTVLAKAAWALLLAPLVALVVGLLAGFVMWMVTALTVSVNGLPGSSAVFTHSHPLKITGNLLAALPVQVLWSLPTIGWLMFCSAWAHTKPFLWAVLVPVLGCVIISMLNILPGLDLPLDTLWYVVAFRGLLSVVPGTWMATTGHDNFVGGDVRTTPDMIDQLPLSQSWQTFATADLWIGVVVGAAFIAGAIYLRRWRELAD